MPSATPISRPPCWSGPFTLPSHMRACGPVQGTQLLFFPDAFQMLTGIDVQELVNQSMPAERVLPSDWRAWANALQAEGDDEARLALIEGFLLPRWQAIAPQRAAGRRYAEWAEALAVRAATSSAGRSLRQIERRVKTWAGLPMRELRAVSRAERAFLAAMNSEGPVNWAELAADTDYADQSHLCRETRRMTGFSPDDLRRRIVSEEAFWAYRLWS
jgi:AraC-like DNA-binding protein